MGGLSAALHVTLNFEPIYNINGETAQWHNFALKCKLFSDYKLLIP